jgi:Ca2+-dependent lipid-binding protein
MKEIHTNNALADERKCNDANQDHIHLQSFILFSYAMRLFKLVILVFVFSYLVGIYWYIFMQYFQEEIVQ